jgi:hypothetical protein
MVPEVSNGTHGTRSKNRRCPVMRIVTVPRIVHHSTGRAFAFGFGRYETDSQSDSGLGFQSDDDDRQKNVDDKKGSTRVEDAKTIHGELVRVKAGNYFVKVKGGKEVRLHTDKTTQMIGEIKKGDRIEAKMNDQNHALSIRSAQKIEQGRDSLDSKN